jgi:hypothetical protein
LPRNNSHIRLHFYKIDPGTRARAGVIHCKRTGNYFAQQQAGSVSIEVAVFVAHLPVEHCAVLLALAPQQPASAQPAQSQTPVTSQPFASQSQTAQAQELPQQTQGACCIAEPTPIEPSNTSKEAQ